MTAAQEPIRDLEVNLAICEAATEEIQSKISVCNCGSLYCDLYVARINSNDMRFITEAREGWPHAIRRALAAEDEVDRLRDEIRMLQEQLEQRGVKV